MIAPISTVSVAVPAPDEAEIRRYCACPKGVDDLLTECLSEMHELSYRVSFRVFPVTRTEPGLDLGFAVTDSKDLQKALEGCDRVLLFAATVGLLPDRLIAKYNRVCPAKALLVQAIGTERVEALCDAFCEEQKENYAAEGAILRPRFSPGYGDLPLALQREVFAALDCPRQLGITLNESLLMTPSKSVTALAGIKTKEHFG
ncbi:MAG: Vitamin B12 dependent methionine synthase activation subunit [Clostridia bacterium]|nr:Vitamin B12 dependent methionine synthase activation subunit [Clostridia bacterium]